MEDTLRGEEHTLGTAEADTFGAEAVAVVGIRDSVGVDADFETTIFVGPAHEAAEVTTEVGGDHLDGAFVNETSGPVHGEDVAFVIDLVTDGNGLGFFVDNDFGSASNAALTHGTSDDRGVGGHTATSGEDSFGVDHADDVLGRGFRADKDDFLASVMPFFALISGENDGTGASARGGGETVDNGIVGLEVSGVESRVEQVIELLRLDAEDRFFFVDQAFVDKVASDLESGTRGALAVTGLEEVELLVLDGVFHILHIVEIVFHAGDGREEFLIDFRHSLFESVDVKRGADASDDVFALRVRKELGVDLLFAGARVAGESDAGAGIFAHVAEDHGLDVDGGAPFIGDAVHLTIDVGAGVVPAAEDRGDSFFELNIGIGREVFVEDLLVVSLVVFDKSFELIGGDFGVKFVTVVGLDLVEHRVHFGTRMSFGDVGEHQHEAAIGIPSKALVVGRFGELIDGLIVKTEVEDGIHHARHGLASARTDRDEQRHASASAEGFAVDFFDLVKVVHDVIPHEIRDSFPGIVVKGAGFGGNGETSGDVDPGGGHFSKSETFSAKDVLAEMVLVGFLEGIDVLLFCHVVLLKTIKGFYKALAVEW